MQLLFMDFILKMSNLGFTPIYRPTNIEKYFTKTLCIYDFRIDC